MNLLDKIAKEISDCFGYDDEEQVRDKLVQELFETGYNVRRAAEEFGVTAHQYDKKMKAFYKNTDAFVFEGVIDNENPYRKLISNRAIEIIGEQFGEAKDVKILDIGGGVGSDCINLAENEYKNITYFEFDGTSCKFAKYRFNEHGITAGIEIINQLHKIPKNSFDVVISIEVLEHVKDPKRAVKDFYSYLSEEGIAIITESFNRIELNFPTHLRSNVRYYGKTISLFQNRGFTLIDGYLDFRPVVFAKGLGLKKQIVGYFNGKLFKLRFKMLHQRFKEIVRKHISI